MGARSFAVVMSLIALVGLLAWGLLSRGESLLEIGDAVPGTELAVLGDGERSGSLTDYEGKWVLVNVWASWCGPCRDEAPDLQRFYEKQRSPSFELVGVATQDAESDSLEFVEEFELDYPQFHDGSGEYAEELKTTGVPENFLFAPSGDLAFVQRGPISAECLNQTVAPLISAASFEDPPETCAV